MSRSGQTFETTPPPLIEFLKGVLALYSDGGPILKVTLDISCFQVHSLNCAVLMRYIGTP